MTETEWLTTNDPQLLLKVVLQTRNDNSTTFTTSERKFRLYAVALARLSYHLLTPASKNAVEVAERFADNLITDEIRENAYDLAIECDHENPDQIDAMRIAYTSCGPVNEIVHSITAYAAGIIPKSTQANLLRHIIGNPFKALHLPTDPTVKAIAHNAYHNTKDGRMDNDILNILADSLEDNNFTDIDTLSQLRSKETKFRGFHLIDKILEKS